LSQVGDQIAQGAGTGAAAHGDCILRGGCLRRQKLMLVVGDYFAEQAGVGLSQEVVERGQISRTEAASFALQSLIKRF